MTVLPFKAPTVQVDVSWAEGKAKCIACQHEWVAVALLGGQPFECPSCKLEKGMFKYPFGAKAGDREFSCLCGCEALVAYQRGRDNLFFLRCMNCGSDQTEAVFG